MNIAFEAQPLFDRQKTGISYCESGLVKELIKNHPEDNFYFQYFSLRNHGEKENALRDYVRKNNANIDAYKCFSGRLYKLITLVFPLPYKWFFKSKSDITHFFNYIVPPFVRGKTVVTVHDLTYITYPETMDRKTKIILKLTAKRSMKRADKIIAVSQFTKNEIVKYIGISSEKIDVVYNAVDLNLYRDDFTKSDIERIKEKYGLGGEYFLYLGTLEPRKNIQRLINAYAELLKKHLNFPYLVIAGKKGWLYEKIFERVKQLNIENKVIFTDYVPIEDAPILMSGAKVFCYPSIYEGYGMPIIEAMACGAPVLTSDCGSLPEVAAGNAVMVDPLSEESIENGLERLYLDEKLRSDLSEKGKDIAKKSEWKVQAEKLYEIYDKLNSTYKQK